MHFLHPITQHNVDPQYLSNPLLDACGSPVYGMMQYCMNVPEGAAYFYMGSNNPTSGFYTGTFQDTSTSYWFNITNGVLQSYTAPSQAYTPYEGYFFDSTLTAVYIYATLQYASNPSGLVGSGIFISQTPSPFILPGGTGVCGGLNGIYHLDAIYGPTYTFVNGSPVS